MPEIFMTDWPQYSPDDMNRRESTLEAVKLMVNAAQTAPNAGEVSQVEAHIVWGHKEQEKIARKMEELAWEVETGQMGGKETIQKLLEINSDVKGIVASGFSSDPVLANCQDYGFCEALPKPYQKDELAKALENVFRPGKGE